MPTETPPALHLAWWMMPELFDQYAAEGAALPIAEAVEVSVYRVEVGEDAGEGEVWVRLHTEPRAPAPWMAVRAADIGSTPEDAVHRAMAGELAYTLTRAAIAMGLLKFNHGPLGDQVLPPTEDAQGEMVATTRAMLCNIARATTGLALEALEPAVYEGLAATLDRELQRITGASGIPQSIVDEETTGNTATQIRMAEEDARPTCQACRLPATRQVVHLEDYIDRGSPVLRCPRCGRLWVQVGASLDCYGQTPVEPPAAPALPEPTPHPATAGGPWPRPGDPR